jgi:formate dehydrogenase subunit gamma
MQTLARGTRALMLGAALALSLAALAQAPAKPAADKAAAPAPAATEAAKAAPPPAPSKGSTAVPGWNNPPSWDTTSERPQYASIPGRETNRLIQGAGREWREFHNGPLTQAGGWILVAVLAVLVLLYLVKGPFRMHGQPTGRLIERFNAVERASHWTVAVSFVLLGLSGVVMFLGKYIVLPWLGYTGFSWLTIISKNVHNFIGPLFIFGLVVMFLLFVKDNAWRAGDMAWVMRFGGMFSGNELPSGRFNGMEKLWFWIGAVVLGLVLAVTGLVLDFPNWNQLREVMQEANVIHVGAAMLFIAAGLAHMYMGIFTVGAYRGMRDGFVDETWAKEHHSLWYEEVKQGKRPEKILAGGAAQPATGD